MVWSRAERGEKGVLGPKKHAPPQSPPRRAPTGRGPGSSGSGSAPGAVCRFSGRGLTVSCAPPGAAPLLVRGHRTAGRLSHQGSRQWPHRDCRGADQGGRQPRPPGLGERFPHFTPPFLPQFQGFFHDPVDIGPSRWRLFGSTQFRAKMAEKMPQNKTTPFVR